MKQTNNTTRNSKQKTAGEGFHILLVANTSWSIYNFRLGLIRYLKNEGYKISVIAPRDRFTSKLIAEGIQCYDLKMNNYGTNPFGDLKLMIQLIKLYKKIKPQLIFHYTIKPNIYGSIAAGVCAIPSIAVTTGLGHLFKFSNIFVRWITRFAYRIAAWLSDEVWFLNANDRDIFVYKHIVRLSKTRVLKGEGINLDWFSLNDEKDYAKHKFLFAGRLIWDKGVREYIKAAAVIKETYPNAEFEIVGFVDENNPNSVPFNYILEWQNKGVIKYLGETSDIRQYLKETTCFVFPSYYREGISRVLMEAAAMETVIITTDNVGCRDLVDDKKNGFLIPPNNIDSLVQAVHRFLELKIEDRLIMAKRGRMKMDHEFNEKNVIQEYMNKIEKYQHSKVGSNG